VLRFTKIKLLNFELTLLFSKLLMNLFKSVLLFLVVGISRIIFSQNCFSYLPSVREDISSVKLCPEVMLDDLQKLRDALDKIHPDLYHYITEDQLDSAYRNAIKTVSKQTTAYEFSKAIALFLSSLKDSHTSYNPQSLIFMGPKNKGTLPFFLIKISDKFYMESLFNDNSLIGKEILQFDSLTCKELFEESRAFSIIEGNAYSAQEEIATKGMALTFSQKCNFKVSDSVKIKYVNGEDTLITKVKATNKMNLYLFKENSIRKPINYFFDHDNKGVLKIHSFQPKTLRSYKREVSNFFEEVEKRNCSEIVVDLRDNQGGYVKAQEYLISYLNFQRKAYTIEHIYKRSNFDPFTKMSLFRKMRFKRQAKRSYKLGIHSEEYDFMKSSLGSVRKILYNEIPENEYNKTYKGKCTLVVNGLSMSASVLFAGWFRHTERGEIIGMPCLGSMNGTFGSSATLNLPGTGLPVMISTVKFNSSFSKETKLVPIIPDRLIYYSVKDLILNRDPVMDYLKITKEFDQSLK
jgi:C-terminal processing protease CtpA/Prc